MSFFFGFFPDENTNYKIRKVVGEVGRVFADFQIPVRWSKPETYHMTVLHVGERLSIFKRLKWRFKLKTICIKPFKVSFNTVRLGISRKYKELVYLDTNEGGDVMREMLLDMRKVLKLKDEGNFVPHLTLGRVSKDLSDEEYSNLCKDLAVVAKGLDIEKIEFYVNDIKLIKSSGDNYSVLMNLVDLSKTKS
jgi:2'-5' RNA ligase